MRSCGRMDCSTKTFRYEIEEEEQGEGVEEGRKREGRGKEEGRKREGRVRVVIILNRRRESTYFRIFNS